jgi:hypothetical protein
VVIKVGNNDYFIHCAMLDQGRIVQFIWFVNGRVSRADTVNENKEIILQRYKSIFH